MSDIKFRNQVKNRIIQIAVIDAKIWTSSVNGLSLVRLRSDLIDNRKKRINAEEIPVIKYHFILLIFNFTFVSIAYLRLMLKVFIYKPERIKF